MTSWALGGSAALGQLDDVAVLIAIASRLSPRLPLGPMEHLCSGGHGTLVSGLDVGNPKRDLGTHGCGSIFGFIQREMHERAVGPTRRGMTATRPRIVALVIVDVKVKAESIAVELRGSIQIRDRQHHRHQPIGVIAHPSRLH